MKAHAHLMAAVPLAAAMGFCNAPAWGIGVAALVSVLIDADHLLDYLLHRRGWRSLSDFFNLFHSRACRSACYALHSWEWIALLAILAALGFPLCGYLALGMGYHLSFDQLLNKMPRFFYFFTYRYATGFLSPHCRPAPGQAP